MTSERAPRAFAFGDPEFSGVSLSRIIAEAGCELVEAPPGADIFGAFDALSPPLDVIVLPLQGDPADMLKALASLRTRDWLASVPILGISSRDRSRLDLWKLRELGVIGLVDSRALPEHVRFRVGKIVYKGREGRRFERAPCCIPVEVSVDGEVRMAYAISLSVGGMGLACGEPIEPNTCVRLRFSIDDEDRELPLDLEGRTVHQREVHREGASYEIGMFFYPLPERIYAALSICVSELLTAWDAVSGMLGDEDAVASASISGSRPR